MNPLRSIKVWPSVAILEAQVGQPLPQYALTLDNGRFYKWIPNDIDEPDSDKVLGSVGGYIGTWHELRCPDAGEDLTDASVTIDIADGEWRTLPAATLSANRALTLSTTNAEEGDVFELTRLDVGAYTYTITNGGAGGGSVFVLPVSTRFSCKAYFDGTNWIPRAAGQLP